MRIRFLGKESKIGDSPTLYATDRDTYLVQGYRVVDPAHLDGVEVAQGQTCVRIYDRLLDHLVADGIEGALRGREAPIVAGVDVESCIIRGAVVTDAAVRAELRLPEHEDVVEVPARDLAALMRAVEWS
ncbi:hypothetical protein CLV63_111185 [Murinocardiopsis flavida]|uniref:Uncharacterized protein n=2 Tax=Murinocardiopsis flavida TaxID=645275 RepID=A0A2P8DH87_9ACTN|nr:hypothetical protein CLV63_111185 [Murinocardiopsis flavida]